MTTVTANELDIFLSQFNFDPNIKESIGIERERFLVNDIGNIVPRAKDFLDLIQDDLWTYELSACQIEDRSIPANDITDVKKSLQENDQKALYVADKLNLKLLFTEVAPKYMPLDVYPDPRYLEIVEHISQERLEAACRVAATHIHIGVSDIYRAIELYNLLLGYLEIFCQLGDHSDGERLQLYKIMAQKWNPPKYENLDHFFEVATEEGFSNNPRDCWHLIRISKHGTVELRMFGATKNVDEICEWINFIQKIVKEI